MKYMYEGKDAFVWLLTGFGKSMCYEVLPFVFGVNLSEVMIVVVTTALESRAGSHLMINSICSKLDTMWCA